jgi:hypothetical protein
LVAAGGWAIFGFSRADDYARERLGRTGRWLRDLAALDRLFQEHPCLARAITGDDGGRPIGRVAALPTGRAVPPHTFGHWIAIATNDGAKSPPDTGGQGICGGMYGNVRPRSQHRKKTTGTWKINCSIE